MPAKGEENVDVYVQVSQVQSNSQLQITDLLTMTCFGGYFPVSLSVARLIHPLNIHCFIFNFLLGILPLIGG